MDEHQYAAAAHEGREVLKLSVAGSGVFLAAFGVLIASASRWKGNIPEQNSFVKLPPSPSREADGS